MIQKIQIETGQPISSKPKAASADTHKTDSFQALLQAASQKMAPTESGDSTEKTPPEKEGRQKDQKDPLKDAAALVQPNTQVADVLPPQVQLKAAAASSELSVSLSADSGKVQKQQAVPALAKDNVSQLITAADLSKAKPVQQAAVLAQAKTVLQPEAQPMQPTASKPIPAEKTAQPLVLQQNAAPKTAAVETAKPQALRADGSEAAVAESSPAVQEKQPLEAYPAQIVTEKSKAENVPVKVVSQTAETNTGRKEDSSPDAFKAAQLSNLYTDGHVVIKVSNAPVAEKVPVAHQISEAVVQGLKNGKQQLQVDLYPQSLGKVSVKLVSEGGMLTVELAASNPKTQSLLASNSGEIRSMLQDTTNHSSVQVAVPDQPAQQQFAQQQNGYAEQNARQQMEEQQTHWANSTGAGNINTDDFLSILKQTGISA